MSLWNFIGRFALFSMVYDWLFGKSCSQPVNNSTNYCHTYDRECYNSFKPDDIYDDYDDFDDYVDDMSCFDSDDDYDW